MTPFDSGYASGRSFGADIADTPGEEPDFEYLSRLNGIMQQASSSNMEAWRRGWVKGAQDAFRKVTPSTRDPNAHEHLSQSNARPGVKLYSFAESHEATILTVDRSRDLMTVRHSGDGTVETKGISALSDLWYVRKEKPSQRRR
jgi:hypothetical protein